VGENAELVRRCYAAFNGGSDLSEFVSPDVEYVNPEYAIEGGTRRGRKEWRQAYRNLRESLGEAEVEIERLVESGDRVAAIIGFKFSGRGSGVPISVTQSHLFTIRDGKVVRFEWWLDPESAVEALEVPER